MHVCMYAQLLCLQGSEEDVGSLEMVLTFGRLMNIVESTHQTSLFSGGIFSLFKCWILSSAVRRNLIFLLFTSIYFIVFYCCFDNSPILCFFFVGYTFFFLVDPSPFNFGIFLEVQSPIDFQEKAKKKSLSNNNIKTNIKILNIDKINYCIN